MMEQAITMARNLLSEKSILIGIPLDSTAQMAVEIAKGRTDDG